MFLLEGWLLAIDASRRALDPPLLALFDSGELDAIVAGCDPGAGPHTTTAEVIAASACAAERKTPADGESVGPLVIEGRLRDDVVTGAAGYSMSVSVSSIGARGVVRETDGGVLLTVYGSLAAGRASEWRAGRRVRVTAQLRLPTAFRDPGVPDNRLALARRGTILVGSVKSGALVDVIGRGTLVRRGCRISAAPSCAAPWPSPSGRSARTPRPSSRRSSSATGPGSTTRSASGCSRPARTTSSPSPAATSPSWPACRSSCCAAHRRAAAGSLCC